MSKSAKSSNRGPRSAYISWGTFQIWSLKCWRYFTSRHKVSRNHNKMTKDPSPSRIVHLDSCIGKGSFSHVYKIVVSDSTNTSKRVKKYEYALKVISLVDRGLRSPIELAVMTQISHPHLTHAIRVEFEDDKTAVKILSPLATGDLSNIIRSAGSRPPMSQLQKWMMQLMSAVAVLHSNGILHGDIKARNVLLFNKPRTRNLDHAYVQLNDFNLSSLILRPQCPTPRRTAYTSTHRAPEILQGQCWGFEADIWALGCTFYEMVYGSSLFPSQRGVGDEKDFNMCAESVRVGATPHPVLGRAPGLLLKPTMLHLDWDKPEMSAFNTLLLRMLTPEISRRPTIFQLILDPYFCHVYDNTILPATIQQRHPDLLCRDCPVTGRIGNPRILDDDGLSDLSSYLYRLVAQMEPEASESQIPAISNLCLRLASKLTNLRSSTVDKSSTEFLVAETHLLQKLQYRLLPLFQGSCSDKPIQNEKSQG